MTMRNGWWMVGLLIACSSDSENKATDTADTGNWFNTGSGGSTTTNPSSTSSTKSSTKSTTTDGDTAFSLSISGLVDPATGEGDIYVSGTECVSTFTVSSPTEATGCTACAFAWVLTVGDLQAGDEDCSGAEAYIGIPLPVGHEEPENFWYEKSGWFFEKNGTSQLQDDGRWYFAYGK